MRQLPWSGVFRARTGPSIVPALGVRVVQLPFMGDRDGFGVRSLGPTDFWPDLHMLASRYRLRLSLRHGRGVRLRNPILVLVIYLLQ